jgi:hypothetical protein
MKSKSKRAQLKADLEEVENGIKDVKDDVDSAEKAMNSTNDEGIRKMLLFTKNQHIAKLHELEAKRDLLKSQIK